MKYYEVVFVDGSTENFDKRCNNINWSDLDYCIFYHGDVELLALIPHNQIKMIQVKDGEKLNECEEMR